jgi:hypothetical protein
MAPSGSHFCKNCDRKVDSTRIKVHFSGCGEWLGAFFGMLFAGAIVLVIAGAISAAIKDPVPAVIAAVIVALGLIKFLLFPRRIAHKCDSCHSVVG